MGVFTASADEPKPKPHVTLVEEIAFWQLADDQNLLSDSDRDTDSEHGDIRPHWRAQDTNDQEHRPSGAESDDDSHCGLKPEAAEDMARWTGHPAIRGSSEAVRMLLLTCSTIGITFVWGVEQTYCTPYLLSLGLTKSNISLVWVAGPLSGLITQPIIGVLADQCTSRWGRRRPFIMGGAVISAISVLVLGFTRQIVDLFVSSDETAKSVTIFLAVLAIYVLDFAVNAVMSTARSLVVDTLPIPKQQIGAAWGGRMSAIGHGLAYSTGAIDLPSTFGTLFGDTQFKQLTVAAAFGILAACGVSCWAVTERVLIEARSHSRNKGGIFHIVREIWTTMRNLPPRIQGICMIQFWSWLGWFPFLFYSTTWIGETYFRYDAPPEARESGDALGQIGKVGSRSFMIYSVVTFTGSWILPIIVRSPDENGDYTKRPAPGMKSTLDMIDRYKPDLLTAWTCGLITFGAAMVFAPFATSFKFATLLVCLCGLPWTLAIWAPTTFLGVEVNRLSMGYTGRPGDAASAAYSRLSADVEMAQIEGPLHSMPAVATPRQHGEPDDDDDDDPRNISSKPARAPGGAASTASSGELSGIYFGILNIYTTIPQFIGTLISSVAFAILEPGVSPELAHGGAGAGHEKPAAGGKGPNPIGVVLFIGAIGSLFAAYTSRKLRHL